MHAEMIRCKLYCILCFWGLYETQQFLRVMFVKEWSSQTFSTLE